MEPSLHNGMQTLEQCHQVAYNFENNYVQGIKFMAKTKSETKFRFAMEVHSVQHDSAIFNSPNVQHTQQINSAPPPPGLNMEQWTIALSTMGSNFSSQQYHAPNSSMPNSSSASTCRNSGGGNWGAPSNRGGRGGGTGPRQGGANWSSNLGRQKPSPNPIQASGKDECHPPQ